ncbi:MAG: M28 family peptidase [Candidatus Zixiibacteriota bacterium]
MKRVLITLLLLLIFATATTFAGDLYRVKVGSKHDAISLKATGARPVARLNDGYLVMLESANSSLLTESGLSYELVESSVRIENLVLDNRHDRSNATRFPMLYEESGFRLYELPGGLKVRPDLATEFRPLHEDQISIDYFEPRVTSEQVLSQLSRLDVGLDTLILRIKQDSLQAYLQTLQGFPYRSAGSTANTNSRIWLFNKLKSFGYDSVVLDPFLLGGSVQCNNVLAYKVGTRYPNHHVIVGAHRDAVTASPGADDNGTGSVAVLEIARALVDVPTDMTIIFALFDAEEDGLVGSTHYVSEAYARGDSIVYMLNMDMIGHYENTTAANVFHGSITTLSNVWIHLADSLVGITGVLAGASSGSDHYPFTQKGYDASFIAESIFSTVYHTNRDSTTYVGYPYMTKLVKASLAATYVVNATAGPAPMLALSYPEGLPTMIPSQAPKTVKVGIAAAYGGVIAPGSEKLRYSINGGAYQNATLTEISSGLYQGTIPATTCDARIRVYATANEVTNGPFYQPDSAHAKEIVVATSSVSLFADNCETNKGWTTASNAADGQWDRGVPAGLGERGDPPTDFDHSGQCYLTDNVYGNSDVDGGMVWLMTPTIDMSSGNGRVHFALWYSNNFGAAPNEDVFKTYISNDNGTNWWEVESVGPLLESAGGWIEHSFWVADYITPTALMKMRFEASDVGSGSVIEAGIDDFTVTRFTCAPPSCCVGLTGNVNGSGGVDLADLSAIVSYLTGGGYPLPCVDEANVNASGTVDLADLSALVSYLTGGGFLLPTCLH